MELAKVHRVQEWLVEQTPQDVDSELASRASSRGIAFARDDTGFRPGLVAIGGPDEISQQLTDLEQAMTPAPVDRIEELLAELDAITAGPAEAEIDTRMKLRAYRDRLARYPGDVVAATVRDWSGKWWPTWAELEAEIHKRAAPRRRMLVALRYNAREPKAAGTKPDQASRARVDEIVKGFTRRAQGI